MSWVFAVLISGAVSGALAIVILSNPIPPGGDPGTWVSTSYAYIGWRYPSQVIPLAYPPVLFPLLGILVSATGNPIVAVRIFAPTLYFTLGLSIFYVASVTLRSRVVALAVMAFLMIDPQLTQMIFWGAYPNLLGFVFLNLALAGLLRMGRGELSAGALTFWISGTLAVLTHSLTGLVLTGGTLAFLLMARASPLPSRTSIQASLASGSLDLPRIIPRALFTSRGGKLGFIGALVAVGVYYAVTYLAHVPHPAYFASNPLAFRVIGLGGTLTALFPGILVVSLGAVYLLTLLVLATLFLYAVMYLRRPKWLTTPVLLLTALFLTVLTIPLVGWLFRIVTDYRRFGFFLLVPVGLAIGYLIDRGWVSARTPQREATGIGSPTSADPLRLRRWLRDSPHPRRLATFVVVFVVLGLIIAGTLTGPGMLRFEKTFTRVGHDQYFLEALSAIKQSKTAGAILTVPGADKWARAIVDRNVYAPYTQAAYLFYQSQILDSELSYYALTSHYAITNGLVTAAIKGVQSPNADGIPTYGIYSVSSFRQILRIDPHDVSVQLVGQSNRTLYTENLSQTPQVVLPPPGAAGPLEVVYTQSDFVFTAFFTIISGSPELTVTFNVIATSSDLIRALNVLVLPSDLTSARVWPATTPGSFNWETVAEFSGPTTIGNVTPASALAGVTTLDPQTSTPAAILSFAAGGGAGARVIAGDLALTTPAASTLFNELPPVVVTPQVWSDLQIRFVLMRNPAYAPQPSVAFPGEVAYLQSEYGCAQLYANPEWTVLETPVT